MIASQMDLDLLAEFGGKGESQENRLDLNYECEVLTTEIKSLIHISRPDTVFHRRRTKKIYCKKIT